jgi:hydroxyquinol 1,2-dioxygenase
MPSDLRTDTLTAAVQRSFTATPDPRLREILSSLTEHLHQFVRDTAPSIQEWEQAIEFLTQTGQKCSNVRQEFILLSDVLGVSMLVETINDEETPEATDSTVLGPFHMVESPHRELGDDISPDSTGERCVVSGRIVSIDGTLIPDAEIDIWQADTEGYYDVQQPDIQPLGNGRALLHAGPYGEFNFRSVVPRYYPIPTDGPVGSLLHATHRHPYRPAHIHFLVKAAGYEDLTTHIFVGGSPYLDSDAVFAVKESLIQEFTDDTDPASAARFGVAVPFTHAHFDIVLQPKT